MSEADIELVRNFMTALDDNETSEYERYLAPAFVFIALRYKFVPNSLPVLPYSTDLPRRSN